MPYPIEALPPVLLEAVLEYHPYGQQPLALVACAAIGNLALAAQARANVARDSTLSGPISLNFMTIAESGERKTTVDRAFGKAVRAWEREQKDAAAPDITAFKAAQQIFEAKMDGLRRGLSGASSGNGKFSPEALEQQIKDLQAREPRPPLVVHLLYEDVTIETLLRDMAAGWPSSAWWSDEGGIVVGGHSFSSEKATYAFACVNRMWDGTDITSRSRVTTGSFEVRGRRLTVSFAFQWTVLTQLIGTGQGASRGTGFLARFLMALPESTMGTRFYKEPPAELPMMRAYESMIRAQLESGYAIKEGSEDSEIDPPTLLLSRDAKIIWTRYYDDTERELQANGDFEDVKDFASKSADNAARLAALFHLARGRGTNESIADGDMKSGCVIAAWHLNEARRIMGMQPSQQEEEAQRLLTWLVTQGGTAALRDVLHTGPSCFRGRGGAGKRDAAIAVLVELVLVRCEIDARIQNIQVHPGYLSQVAMRRAG